jgi:hypothetical protein
MQRFLLRKHTVPGTQSVPLKNIEIALRGTWKTAVSYLLYAAGGEVLKLVRI